MTYRLTCQSTKRRKRVFKKVSFLLLLLIEQATWGESPNANVTVRTSVQQSRDCDWLLICGKRSPPSRCIDTALVDEPSASKKTGFKVRQQTQTHIFIFISRAIAYRNYISFSLDTLSKQTTDVARSTAKVHIVRSKHTMTKFRETKTAQKTPEEEKKEQLYSFFTEVNDHLFFVCRDIILKLFHNL